MTLQSLDRYAVYGQPIKHSKSPRIHQLFAEQVGHSIIYTAQEVTPEQFNQTVQGFFADGGKGLNCTLPLKELAWAIADQKTKRAQLSKAVNTLAIQPDGSILGDNTDGHGLIADLKTNHGISFSGVRVLILGAGGATRGIVGPILDQAPRSLTIANRSIEKAVKLADEFNAIGAISGCGYEDLTQLSFDLIINATSASLSNQLPPLSNGLLAVNGSCYDLAYGNEPTAFVQWGLANNALKSMDGLGMLVEQAAEAFFIWRGVHPDTQGVIDLLNSERWLG